MANLKNKLFIIVLLLAFVSVLKAQEPQNKEKTSVKEWAGKLDFNLPAIDPVVISNSEIMNIAGGDGSGVFSAGDTVLAVEVAGCRTFLFAVKDSTISGGDSLKAFVRFKSGGVTYYAPLAMHDLGQTTATTNTLFMIPGDGAGACYSFSLSPFAGSNQLFTGTIYIARLNTRTGEAVYAAKTRYNYIWF